MKTWNKVLLAAALCFICNTVLANASVLQESPQALNSGATFSQASTAFTSNATIGSTIEAWVESPGVTPSSCSDGVNAGNYSLKVTLSDATNGQVTLLYVFQNNQSATKLVVTCTFGASAPFAGVWTKEIGGVTSASYQTSVGPAPQVNPGTGADAITSGGLTPSSAPALISSMTVQTGGSDTAASTAGTGMTAGTTGFGAGGVNLATSESLRVTSTSSKAMTYTNSGGASGTFSTIAASYTETGAGGGSQNGVTMLLGVGE